MHRRDAINRITKVLVVAGRVLLIVEMAVDHLWGGGHGGCGWIRAEAGRVGVVDGPWTGRRSRRRDRRRGFIVIFFGLGVGALVSALRTRPRG